MKHVRRTLWAIVETIWFAAVLVVLLIWILPDFIPRRRKRK